MKFVKVSIEELYLHKDTKICLRLDRNQNAQRWIGKKVSNFNY